MKLNVSILTIEDVEKLHPQSFMIYSDNILEGSSILDLLIQESSFLDVIGICFEPIDQPIYVFREKKGKKILCVKIAGKYENWDLPESVDSIIHFIDKPDLVILDTADNECLFVGETTGTANVGNSQWQREGRKISAAVKGIPMVYQTYYSGTDRSKITQTDIDDGKSNGQVREPSSLQVINHFLYSLRYRVPSFVVYYPNKAEDTNLNKFRDNKGVKLFMDYISICLLYKLDKVYKEEKKDIELKMYKKMLDYILEPVPSRGNIVKRIQKDFPVQPPLDILTLYGEKFVTFLVDWVNKDISTLRTDLNIIDWDFSSFFKWQNRYKKTPLIKGIYEREIPIYSYLKNTTKSGFVLDTLEFIKFLDNTYPKDRGKFSHKLNKDLPTLIIPTLMFQKKDNGKIITKVDPGTGEIVAFSELFARDEVNNKSMNVLVYVHVPASKRFSTETKLFRAIKRYADCILINEEIYEL